MPAALRFLATLVALLAVAASPAASPAVAAPDAPCRDVEIGGKSYTICTFDLRSTAIRLHWKDRSGAPYGNVSNFVAASKSASSPLLFAMNAGMYRVDSSPVGLYVEGGEQLVKANTASGPGNFHLKPNGVFYLSGDEASVLETGRFLKARPKADYATQSGPMLVIDGKLHPRFSANGPSLKIRNGVGIRDPHTVVFAISNDAVSFGDFARLFRDSLACPNALFLDGSISSLYAPSVARDDTLWPAGPILSARTKAK